MTTVSWVFINNILGYEFVNIKLSLKSSTMKRCPTIVASRIFVCNVIDYHRTNIQVPLPNSNIEGCQFITICWIFVIFTLNNDFAYF